MTSRITSESNQATTYPKEPTSNANNSNAFKVTLLALGVLALSSSATAIEDPRDYTTISVGTLGTLDVPTQKMAEAISEKCTSQQFIFQIAHTMQLLESPEYKEADEKSQQQMVKCISLQLAQENIECVSDEVIKRTLDFTSPTQEASTYERALENEKTCEAYELQGIACDTSSYWKDVRKARIKLLESESKDKQYFKSHSYMLQRIEDQRARWQCKNLQDNIKQNTKRYHSP